MSAEKMHRLHRIKVWDPSIRLFHWTLVAAFLFLWWSGIRDEWMEYHPLVGCCVLGLLIYRIVWGFVGTRYARFSDFVRGPRATIQALAWLAGKGGMDKRYYLSHNPVGGWMVLLLLALLLFQGLTGLGSSDDISIDGPMVDMLSATWVERLSGWHRFNLNILLVLIGLHILAVLLHDLYRRDGLVTSMLHGFKASPQPAPATELPVLRLLLIVAGIGTGIYFLL